MAPEIPAYRRKRPVPPQSGSSTPPAPPLRSSLGPTPLPTITKPNSGGGHELPSQDVKPLPAVSYDVGYGKPPRSGCFKKGQRANPRGRPKGSKSAMTIFREEAEVLISVRENGRTRKMSKLRVGIRNRVNALVVKPDLKSMIAYLKLMNMLQAPDLESEKEKMPGQEDAEMLAALMEEFMREVVSFGGAVDPGQVTFPLDE